MKIIKTLLKITGGLLVVLLLLLGGAYLYLNEPEPGGISGPEADQLAMAMMDAVDKAAWDSTRWVRWTYRGEHQYLWNKETNWVKINWEDYEVMLNTKAVEEGKAYRNGKLVAPDSNQVLVQQAWKYFCNDSFWLNPVVKAFDPGTERYIVDVGDGRKGVKVKYTSGGVTPGDAYLWILDDNNRPAAWKMWTQVLPVDGVEIKWGDWMPLSTGALISTSKEVFGRKFSLVSEVKGGMRIEDVGVDANPFEDLAGKGII